MLSYAILLLEGVAACALVIAAVVWRRALLMALPFLAVLNGLSVPLVGVSLRADQLAGCLLAIPLAAQLLTGARRLRTDATVWWLAALLALNLLSSVLHSPARAYSLLQCLNLASVWIIYVVLINALDTREELEQFLRRCLWAAASASAIGIAAFVLAIAGIPLGGAEVSVNAVEHLTNAYGAYGTMLEPNIFGSFAGAYLTIAVGLLAAARPAVPGHPARTLRWLAALTAAGLVLSFTRAAWIGALAGVACFAMLGTRMLDLRFRLSRVLAPVGVGAALMLAVALVAGNTGNLLRYKLFNLLNLESQSAALRLTSWALALQQTLVHPVIGWGTFTFAPLVAEGSDFQRFEGWRNLWIGNFLLLALHDTGTIGLALWIGLIGTILVRGVRAIRRLNENDPAAATSALVLTAAVASLLLPFLATSGFSMGYSWVLVGLLGAYCHIPLRER